MKITISGAEGVGKKTITRLLANKTGCTSCIPGENFRKIAEDLNLTIYEMEFYAKENPDFDRRLDEQQKECAQNNDDFILESRIGWFFAPDAFSIKLVCDENERMKRIKERDGGDIFQIKNDEDNRLKLLKERFNALYGIEDFLSDKNFDLVVDTTNLKPEEIVDIILSKTNV